MDLVETSWQEAKRPRSDAAYAQKSSMRKPVYTRRHQDCPLKRRANRSRLFPRERPALAGGLQQRASALARKSVDDALVQGVRIGLRDSGRL